MASGHWVSLVLGEDSDSSLGLGSSSPRSISPSAPWPRYGDMVHIVDANESSLESAPAGRSVAATPEPSSSDDSDQQTDNMQDTDDSEGSLEGLIDIDSRPHELDEQDEEPASPDAPSSVDTESRQSEDAREIEGNEDTGFAETSSPEVEPYLRLPEAADSSCRPLSLSTDQTTPADSSSGTPREGEDSNPTTSSLVSSSTNVMPSDGEVKAESKTLQPSHPDEPPAKVRRRRSSSSDEGTGCAICLEAWGCAGEHRPAALRCGHVFGARCVERWLRAQKLRDRSCPTCKTRANVKDMRYIYVRKLVAADTSQITELQKQLDELQAEKSRVELELQKSKITHRACVLQLEVLRSTLMKSQANKEQPIRRSWRFAMEKNMEVSKDGGCRVLTYNCRTYELYVSQKSTNNLFPGYGIRKVSCVDYKLGQFVHLHPKPIRDITYSQPRELLLSVGLDSSARIVERGIPTTTVQSGYPLWSCSWDYLRGNEFYVGGVGGVIHQYDVRNPSTYIQRLSNATDMSPVVSLCSTEYGLLSCQLNSCWLWVGNNRQWEPRALPVEGPFMSLCYDNESHRALVSCRPSTTSCERSRLTLCKLKPSTSGEVLFDVEQTFHGSSKSSLMSRPAWVKAPGASWVAAHSESDSMLYLHGLDGTRSMSLLAAEPALDVCSVQMNGDTIVAALSESRLRIYKSVAMN